METRIEKITDIRKAAAVLSAAGKIIENGGLVAFPTETVYGLGANGLDSQACSKIYAAKGRPSDNPLILHVADRAMIDMAAAEVTPLVEQLITAFCPGPITIILKKKACVPDSVTGGLDTVGIRMPDNDIAREFIRAAGMPIAAPSANISGRPSPTTAAAVMNDMQGRIPLILDGGACDYGVESTIVEVTGETVNILRPGAITPEMLGEIAEKVTIDPALTGEKSVPKAPGMKYTHYAPKAPLTIIGAETVFWVQVIKERQQQGEKLGLIVSEETKKDLKEFGVNIADNLIVCYGKRRNLKEIAAKLYETLRYFDDKAVTSLLGETVEEAGLGLAIMNRLRKAAGGRMVLAENEGE